MRHETVARPYLAAPISVLRRANWPVRVRQIGGLVGGALWDPAALFGSTAEWLREWPHLLGSVSGLILVPDTDGGIGAGCLREISDVLGLDRPVWIYESGALITWGEAMVRPIPHPTRFKVATVHGALREPAKPVERVR